MAQPPAPGASQTNVAVQLLWFVLAEKYGTVFSLPIYTRQHSFVLELSPQSPAPLLLHQTAGFLFLCIGSTVVREFLPLPENISVRPKSPAFSFLLRSRAAAVRPDGLSIAEKRFLCRLKIRAEKYLRRVPDGRRECAATSFPEFATSSKQ